MKESRVNDEIMAVIAAVVASMADKPGVKLKVKSFRRIHQSSPVWNTTGRIERLRRNLNS